MAITCTAYLFICFIYLFITLSLVLQMEKYIKYYRKTNANILGLHTNEDLDLASL